MTKQNGSDPLFTSFTSICQVPGYLWYGNCNLSATTNTEITGRIDAVQPKVGRWNLDFTFTHVTPGAVYRLWGNQSGASPLAFVVDGFFLVGTGTAGLDGTVRFSYQTTSPTNLGFDLNVLASPDQLRGTTVVTSYWSNQWIAAPGADGTLSVKSP